MCKTTIVLDVRACTKHLAARRSHWPIQSVWPAIRHCQRDPISDTQLQTSNLVAGIWLCDTRCNRVVKPLNSFSDRQGCNLTQQESFRSACHSGEVRHTLNSRHHGSGRAAAQGDSDPRSSPATVARQHLGDAKPSAGRAQKLNAAADS